MGNIVDSLVSKEVAAKQKAAEEEERRKAYIRAELAAVEPRRKSERATAAQTRLKLAKHAESKADVSGSGESDSERSASQSGLSREEEVDYDPVADVEHTKDDQESSEEEDEQKSEEGQDSDRAELQQPPRRSRQGGNGKSGRRGKDKQPAGQWDAEPIAMSDEDDGCDADLQRALAMSLMEANGSDAGPSTSAGNGQGPSGRGFDVPDQQAKQPAASALAASAKPSGRNGRKAKGQGTGGNGSEQQGKVRSSGKRKKVSALEAGPQEIKKAFSMIAPRSKRISQEALAVVRNTIA